MPENNGPDDRKTEPRQFINEKIVRQPMSKRDMLKRALGLFATAVIFGIIAAVTFAVSRPVAERFFAKGSTSESIPVTIPKDDPETMPSEVETGSAAETEPIEDILKSAMEKYPFSVDDLNTLYGSLRTLVQKADKGIVTVHSVKTQTDWFNNPVENSSLFSGVIIATANQELLVLTPDGAVEDAEAIRVAFSDGTEVQGTIKQTDKLSGMAIVSVSTADLGRALLEEIKAIELGNSYSVKQGDLVVAIGGPAGMVHSVGYGFISYITKNVQITDGMTRILYSDVKGSAGTGTFLMNTSGQIIGWVTDEHKNDSSKDMTAAMAISDYKSILGKMSNGVSYPYFGIKGQEVSAVMNSNGMPLGVYVVDVNADSPAYNAGIQCGDIIRTMGKETIVTMKDFQSVLENSNPGDVIPVSVSRNGREEYKEIQFQVTIGAR
ncbi:MAG TPA: PDZ domain-containing protein [Lachnoclostridium sp.]|uniref:Serine protease Do/serine protease DegQ n=1 Tax=[Clostridium] celerecrescens 18A TaxID=1286362 RepID=A0A2M8Z912_9FIRM|nr:PDZ domain-containing protein [Lacrimispora celerecrescens]PJJ29932.1 serine protease Do/serine protease DegQ [[Clostridium] celerecrescens 18A]HBE85098.1 PDZ domain-containing protein [Lachnoclostridium sp.]